MSLGRLDLAARLDDSFAVLTKGRRTALPRHQTLRAAMDWSYDLLPEAEQTILRRLAVFPCDFTMDAASGTNAGTGMGSRPQTGRTGHGRSFITPATHLLAASRQGLTIMTTASTTAGASKRERLAPRVRGAKSDHDTRYGKLHDRRGDPRQALRPSQSCPQHPPTRRAAHRGRSSERKCQPWSLRLRCT